MNIFTNNDIKKLFTLITGVLIIFICLSQILERLLYGSFNIMFLLLSLLLAISVLCVGFLYFREQNRLMEDAISQINHFISGDTNARLECDNEGSLYKLFHTVNTLATTLDAHALAEQKMREFLKDTISDISHQLKTPLAALNIYNSILQDDNENIESVKEFALKSERELDRIETLVQNLLKITRLDAGIIVMDKCMENLANMMDEIRLHFEIRAEMEQKTIIMSGPSDAIIFCDRNWILEAVSNIVNNAFDHTGKYSQITVQWQKLPAVTLITVKDNGSGIHSEDIHHIFKRFYRSCFSKDTQGAGLGLSLAKAIAEAHDGNITADSVPGKGSAFIISFLNLTKL